MAAAEGGGAAPRPGRRGAGPPWRSWCAGAGRSGSRMKELRFGPRLGGRDGPGLRTRRQLGSLGVFGGEGSCQAEAEGNEAEVAEKRGARPSAIAASRCRHFLYSLPPSPAFRP